MAIDTPPDKPFLPQAIAVMTISDTRTLADDKSGNILVSRLEAAGHRLAARVIVKDEISLIRAQVAAWIDDPAIPIILTTGGTGLTGRDITPEAVEPLLEKRMDGFSALFHQISAKTIGTMTIQSRCLAGVARGTYIFCLPGSPGACTDAWDHILGVQFDSRTKPSNFIDLMPRLEEHRR
jgi:molybdopterin adenylyltransferase